MKFRKYRMSALNEAMLQSAVQATDNDDLDLVVAVDPGYGDAISQSRRIKKATDDRLKDFDANMKEFAEDNQKREKEGKAKMELKKMHLSEALFEDAAVTEAVDFGDPLDMGRGACAPLAVDYTDMIAQYVKHIGEDPREEALINGSLLRVRDIIVDRIQEVENFNTYWITRYPALVDFMNKQLQMIPEDILNNSTEIDEDIDPHFFADDELVESSTAIEEPQTKKRNRSTNQKKEKRNYSSEDLWLAIYDELCATVDNEGEGQEVNKQVKAKRGERYEHVYPHGDTDIVVYAQAPEDFDFARKVCEYYGVKCEEPKEDKNKNTNAYYKYSMIIRIPEDSLYSEEE